MNLTTIEITIIAIGCLIGGILIGTCIVWIMEAKKVNRGSNKSNVISSIIDSQTPIRKYQTVILKDNHTGHETEIHNVKWFEFSEEGNKLTISCAKYKPV